LIITDRGNALGIALICIHFTNSKLTLLFSEWDNQKYKMQDKRDYAEKD